MKIEDKEFQIELRPLIEQMARNVHEVWAESRISQGWVYGEQRDDEKKTHPCLVPYEELPEDFKCPMCGATADMFEKVE